MCSERPLYGTFEFDNYPNHPFPFDDTPRALYGPLGDFLVIGYDLYGWKETRLEWRFLPDLVISENDKLNLGRGRRCRIRSDVGAHSLGSSVDKG